MAYLLDSDVLIRAKNDHYGFDFCPAFWDWLDAANAAGIVHSVEAVYNELIGDGRRRIKIPNAATANGVRHLNPFQMLRNEAARFVLKP